MKKMLILVVVLTFAFAASGCFKHTFDVGAGAPNGKEVYSSWHSHWLFGIIGDKKVDVKDLCPSGDATIHNEISFLNGLVGAFVGVIYYPTTVKVTCKGGGKSAELQLDKNEMAAIVANPGFLHYVADVAPEMMARAEQASKNAQAYLNGDVNYALNY